MTRLLVLGATGIIGTEIVSAASSLGWEITAVSRRGLGSTPPVGVRSVSIDGRDISAVAEAINVRSRFDAIVDLVAFSAADLGARLNVLLGMTEHYLFASSATIFQSGEPSITEESPRRQVGWRYVDAKLECEAHLRSHAEWQRITIFRPYITFGSGRVPFGIWESDVVVPMLSGRGSLILPVSVGCAQTSITGARDVGRAIVGLACNPSALGEDFNVASDRAVSWRDVAQFVSECSELPVPFDECPDDDFLRAFPRLSGKFSDRMLNRSFDVQKLRSVVKGPLLEDDWRPALRLELSSAKPRDGFGAANWGRYQRLGGQVPAAARQRIETDPTSRLKFQVGLRPHIDGFAKAVQGLLPRSRRSADDYAVA